MRESKKTIRVFGDLAFCIKAEEITAEYADGVLKLQLPKKEHTQPTAKQLEIK